MAFVPARMWDAVFDVGSLNIFIKMVMFLRFFYDKSSAWFYMRLFMQSMNPGR